MVKVNFGCGLSCGTGWRNYDTSPTLRLQRLPAIGGLARRLLAPEFPDLARFGNVTRGLPEQASSVDLVYCSHVLEHLALEDFRRGLREVLRVLTPGGVFRGVLPDLEAEVQRYLDCKATDACSQFMRDTSLGLERRPTGLLPRLRSLIGNSQHLWMWDYTGLEAELQAAGFAEVRRAQFADSPIPDFSEVEDAGRWEGCLGFECRKPLA